MPELIGIQLTDKISVPSKRSMTDAGQMIVPCAFARIGSQRYTAASLGLTDEDPKSIIEVHRLEDDVFAEDSMSSFRSSPVTIGHPKDSEGKSVAISSDNAKELQVGMLEGMPVRDENLLTGTLVITDQGAIDTIEAGDQELSAGYTCDIELTDGIYYQKNIRANHIAIVAKGRAGSNCAIADEEDPETESFEVKKKPAAKKAVAKKGKEEVIPFVDLKSDPPKSTAKATYTKHTVDHLISMMDDALAVEAAEYVALYEENETYRMEDEAQWYADMAETLKARAVAHQAVADAAHKIAKKVGKEMKDENDLVEQVGVILDESDQLKLQLDELVDMTDSKLESRISVILIAKEMTDLGDFKGLTELDIKKLVLDSASVDYATRTDAYIEARFDVLCEDSDRETPMTKLQRKHVTDTVIPTKYVNPAMEARKKMIDSQTNKQPQTKD